MRGFVLAVSVLAIALSLPSSSNGVQHEVTEQVYFKVAIGDEPEVEIVIGLFGKVAPKTVKNFVTIATEGIDGKTYAGTTFHRVIQRFMIQGGDIVSGDGKGSISIYGKYFDDEGFSINHTGPGFISMANAGINTNGCQFFITTMATPWLDSHHTVFGKVVKGQDIIHKIEHVKTDGEDHPIAPIKITESGLVPTAEPFFVEDQISYEYGYSNEL